MKKLFMEIFRYGMVGGMAFLLDTGVLFLVKECFIPMDYFFFQINISLMIATTIGFICGLIFNYILSIYFVFQNTQNKISLKQSKPFILFAITGIIGLFLTWIGMQIGVEIFQYYYIHVKIIVTILVLGWNYLSRKFFIFK